MTYIRKYYQEKGFNEICVNIFFLKKLLYLSYLYYDLEILYSLPNKGGRGVFSFKGL